jgi:hypothetical protein
MKITVTIPIEEAERVLRDAAKSAALYGAYVDYITRRTGCPPAWGGPKTFEDARKQWQARFLKAKATVECFGVEYEPTSEPETLTIGFENKPVRDKRGRQVVIAGLFRRVESDYTKPIPEYRRHVHECACSAAADRVVRRWRENLTA